VLRRAVHRAGPIVIGALLVAGVGAVLIVRAIAAPARSARVVEPRTTLGRRLARFVLTTIASALLRRVADRAVARRESARTATEAGATWFRRRRGAGLDLSGLGRPDHDRREWPEPT
jgi:hypothetical protein